MRRVALSSGRSFWTASLRFKGLNYLEKIFGGTSVLLQPDPDAPAQAWLILGAQADPQRIVETLAKARWSIDGPRGQVSLYSQELGWQNWISPQRRLVLHEKLSLKNLRAVAGNFASSQPWSFIAIIMAFTLCSAIVGMIIAVLARRRN